MSAICLGVLGRPSAVWLMSEFWQNKHVRLQPAKKMVPLPPLPTRHGSSPKCGPADATIA